MTTSTTSPPKPRTRPAPSQRDQEIYREYQAAGKRQSDLAEKYKLTQCRISQIIRRIDQWLAAGQPVQSPMSKVQGQEGPASTLDFGPGTLDSARETLDRVLERERLNFVCRHAIREFSSERVTVTHKKGTRGDKAIDETTERREPPSIQCLKVILQANAQFSRLESRVVGQASRRPVVAVGWDKAAPAAGPPQPDFAQPDSELASQPAVGETAVQWEFPDFPPENGWYSPVRDERGWIVAWQRTEHQTPDSYGRRTGGIEPAAEQESSLPETEAPAADEEWTPPTDLAPPPPIKLGMAPRRTGAWSPPTPEQYAQKLQEIRERTRSSTCAPPQQSPQAPAAQKVAPESAKQKTSPPLPHMPAELRPLYEKIRRVHQMQAKGLPYLAFLDEQEQRQMYLLPPIILEPS